MVYEEDDVFESLNSNPYNKQHQENNKWTLALALCCLSATLGSFQFGFNLSSLNSPSGIIKSFIKIELFIFNEYHANLTQFKRYEDFVKLQEIELKKQKLEYEDDREEFILAKFSTDLEEVSRLEKKRQDKQDEYQQRYNTSSIEDYLYDSTRRLVDQKIILEIKRNEFQEIEGEMTQKINLAWTLLNSMFVLGGMTGALSSKYVMDMMGRKKGLIFHNLFSLLASVLVVLSVYVRSPVMIFLSRYFFGVQGGLTCSIVPTYLSEVSPNSLRGQTGVLHQLCITLGIFIAQTLGFRQILGSNELWNFLLAVPCIPALISSLSLILFFPETPKALLTRNKDYEAAFKALKILRNTPLVKDELLEMEKELNSGDQTKLVSIFGLFRQKDLKWSLITAIVLQVTQQCCGVNAIFFYSATIFSDAGIPQEYIQYTIFATGFVNVLVSIICIPLIDRLGRRPLLLVPLVVIILNYITLVLVLTFKGDNQILSYISVVCILIFIICFAMSFGPIPFIYAAECFRQNSRSSAMAFCSLINWTSSFFITSTFPFLQQLIQQYVFLIFAGLISISFVIILKKVPETKGKPIEEVLAKLNK